MIRLRLLTNVIDILFRPKAAEKLSKQVSDNSASASILNFVTNGTAILRKGGFGFDDPIMIYDIYISGLFLRIALSYVGPGSATLQKISAQLHGFVAAAKQAQQAHSSRAMMLNRKDSSIILRVANDVQSEFMRILNIKFGDPFSILRAYIDVNPSYFAGVGTEGIANANASPAQSLNYATHSADDKAARSIAAKLDQLNDVSRTYSQFKDVRLPGLSVMYTASDGSLLIGTYDAKS